MDLKKKDSWYNCAFAVHRLVRSNVQGILPHWDPYEIQPNSGFQLRRNFAITFFESVNMPDIDSEIFFLFGGTKKQKT